MKPSQNGNADACTWFETAASSPSGGGSSKGAETKKFRSFLILGTPLFRSPREP